MKRKYKLISDTGLVLYEGESVDPMEDLYFFKRKTFGDTIDKEFRQSGLRHYLKRIMNSGGSITIQMENPISWLK